MSPEDGGIGAPYILGIVERAIIRVPRSSHHGLTRVPTAVKIAGRTYLDLAKLRNIGVEHLPEVVLAARMYHLAHTHRALIVTGQCALWAHGWPGLVLWTGCFEGCWLLLVVLCPLACVLVG